MIFVIDLMQIYFEVSEIKGNDYKMSGFNII